MSAAIMHGGPFYDFGDLVFKVSVWRCLFPSFACHNNKLSPTLPWAKDSKSRKVYCRKTSATMRVVVVVVVYSVANVSARSKQYKIVLHRARLIVNLNREMCRKEEVMHEFVRSRYAAVVDRACCSFCVSIEEKIAVHDSKNNSHKTDKDEYQVTSRSRYTVTVDK